jgi:hypothetical protein
MSRSKRARVKSRRRVDAGSPSVQRSPSCDAALPAAETSRLGSARRRARIAKLGVGAAAAVGLGVAMGMARVTYAGHSKHAIRTLSIPQPLYEVVRRNLLQAGILAPATAPPDATTSTS